MTKPLGKIERIADLRSVWAHEEYDFSKWLSEEPNIKMLSDVVGIDIVLEELESPVGNFSVDIFASEDGTNRKIIIENQLEETNHDHLGKIITYAAGKDADIIIWIVKKARDEHQQAIEWLNEHTDGNIGFFLVEVELWQIDNSAPAVKFNVIERPNDWAKNMKTADGLSETKKLQLDFWTAFADYAFNDEKFSHVFSKRKPAPQHWYDISLGSSSYHIGLTVNTQKKNVSAGIYIQDDKEIFNKFMSRKEDIEKEIGTKLEWVEAEKDCRIILRHNGDIKKGEESWSPIFQWFMNTCFILRDVTKKFGV